MERNPEWEEFLSERVQYALNLLQLHGVSVDLEFDYEESVDHLKLAYYCGSQGTIFFYMAELARSIEHLKLSEEQIYPYLASSAFHEVRHIYQAFWDKVNLAIDYAPEDFKKLMELIGTDIIVYPKEKTAEAIRKELLLPTELDATAFSGELTLRLYGYHIPLSTAEQVEKIQCYKPYIRELMDGLGIKPAAAMLE